MTTRRLLSLYKRGPLLFVTAAPGIQRLGFIALLSLKFNNATVGIVAGDIGISAFLALIAGGTVSGQVLALWQRSTRDSQQARLLLNCTYWLIMCILLLIPAIYLLHEHGAIAFPLGSALFFIGFSLWQFCRTIFIAEKKIVHTALMEILTFGLLGITIALFSTNANSCLVWYGSILVFTGTASLITISAPRRSSLLASRHETIKGSELKNFALLAANGIISSGRDHLTVPAVRFLADDTAAGIVAQATSVVSSLLLIPRALVNHHLPALSQRSSITFADIKLYRGQMRLALALLALLHIATTLAILITSNDKALPLMALLAGLALLSNQLSLFASSILTVQQKITQIAFSAFWSTTIWSCGIFAIAALNQNSTISLTIFFVISISLGIGRAIYLERILKD